MGAPTPRAAAWAVTIAGCLAGPPPQTAEPAPGAARGPVGPGALYEPGEVRAFRIVQAGYTLGHSYGRYLGPEGTGRHVFETKVEIRVPARPVARSEGRIVYDDRGAVVEGYERSDAAEIRFHRAGDTLVLESGRQREELGYEPGRSPVVAVARYVVLHQEVAWASLDLRADEVEARVLSLSGGLPVAWSAEVHERPGGNLRLETNLGETIELAGRKIVRIDVPDDELWVTAEPDAAFPDFHVRGPVHLSYTPPADATWRVRSVEIPAAEGAPRLAGELLVPEGPGPHPAVLILSGAGRQDRHGFAGPPPVDTRAHVWTDALARAGVAVLRFDDRGTGASGDGRLDFRAEALDARRALGVLLVQEDIDPNRVAIVGHGEGGWHALSLAREDPTIRAVVLVGTPGRRYDRIVRHQAQAALSDLPPPLRKEALAALEADLAALRRNARTGAALPVTGDEAAYLRQILAVDPRKLFVGLCARVLVLQGGADFEVDPTADPAALVAAARSAGVAVEQAFFDGIDHHLVPVEGGTGPRGYLDASRPVHTPAVRALVSFVTGALAPGAGASERPAGCASASGAAPDAGCAPGERGRPTCGE